MPRKKRAWNMSNPLYRYLHRKGKAKSTTRTVRTRSVSMARHRFKRRGRSRGGMGMGRLLSMKNILFTLGGAYVASRVLNMDPKLGSAAGGFLGAGPIGAVAGYVAGPMVLGMIPNLGGASNSTTGAW